MDQTLKVASPTLSIVNSSEWYLPSSSAYDAGGDLETEAEPCTSSMVRETNMAVACCCNDKVVCHHRERDETLLGDMHGSSVYSNNTAEEGQDLARDKLPELTRLSGSAFHIDYVITQVLFP